MKMQIVYNGKFADDMTKTELIQEILIDSGISEFIENERIIRAMEESFRQGFLRGENYCNK